MNLDQLLTQHQQLQHDVEQEVFNYKREFIYALIYWSFYIHIIIFMDMCISWYTNEPDSFHFFAKSFYGKLS